MHFMVLDFLFLLDLLCLTNKQTKQPTEPGACDEAGGDHPRHPDFGDHDGYHACPGQAHG
jgi:hypothetical protein